MPTFNEETVDGIQSSGTEVDDLIGSPPGFLLNSGISMIAIVTFLLIFLSGWISYPDKFTAQGQLSSSTPPIEHKSQHIGIIDSIMVKDQSEVTSDDIIVVYKNEVSYQDYVYVKNIIDSFDQLTSKYYTEIELKNIDNLGALENAYVQLKIANEKLRKEQQEELTNLKIHDIRKDAQSRQNTLQYLEREKKYLKRTHDIDRKQFERDSTLTTKGLISEEEYEKSLRERILSDKENSLFDKEIRENKISLNKITLQENILREERNLRIQELTLGVEQAIAALQSQLTLYEKENHVRAEVSGIVIMNNEITEGRFLEGGELIFTIMRKKRNRKYAEIKLPSQGISTIGVGTAAIVRFLNYPHKEYGTVHTQVSHIAVLPERTEENDFLYSVQVALNDTLHTTYGMQLPYEINSPVEVDIITKDKSILSRVFEQFFNIIYNK